MADVFTKKKRSEVMSKIRSRGNRDTEVYLARLFRKEKIWGWRRHYPIFGLPDFAFPEKKITVFVDGCFWHGCPKCKLTPVQNSKFWREKLRSNKIRDMRVNRTLRKIGWTIIRIWECDLRKTEYILEKITPVRCPVPQKAGDEILNIENRSAPAIVASVEAGATADNLGFLYEKRSQE